MLKKVIFSLFLLLLDLSLFAGPINSSNYKTFIGKKIKFANTIQKEQDYKIARKKFSAKKYAGKTFTIEDIKLDKKENIILFLTTTLDNKKEKKFKIKTKTSDVEFENISVLWPPKPKKTPPKKAISAYSSITTDYQNNSEERGWELILFILFIPIIFIVILCKRAAKRRELLEEVTDIHRGELSEQDLILGLRQANFPPENIFHDLYIPIGNKRFSQVDLVLLTHVGLIVFEVKDYSGWIFGNGKQQKWTQVLNYGKEKHRFYNPVMQNQQHISRLKAYLGQNIPCFSVVVFYENCELKDVSLIPQNTYITTHNSVIFATKNILRKEKPVSISEYVIPLLKQAVEYGNDPAIRKKHISNIHDMLGEDRIFR